MYAFHNRHLHYNKLFALWKVISWPWYTHVSPFQNMPRQCLAVTLSRIVKGLLLFMLTSLYLLTPQSEVLLQKLISAQVDKGFLTFVWTCRYITLFTPAHHTYQSSATLTKSTLQHTNSLMVHLLILSFMTRSCEWSLPSKYPISCVCISPFSPKSVICFHHLITLIIYSSSSSLCKFYKPPINFSIRSDVSSSAACFEMPSLWKKTHTHSHNQWIM
jgi:hypothetical protein